MLAFDALNQKKWRNFSEKFHGYSNFFLSVFSAILQFMQYWCYMIEKIKIFFSVPSISDISCIFRIHQFYMLFFCCIFELFILLFFYVFIYCNNEYFKIYQKNVRNIIFCRWKWWKYMLKFIYICFFSYFKHAYLYIFIHVQSIQCNIPWRISKIVHTYAFHQCATIKYIFEWGFEKWRTYSKMILIFKKLYAIISIWNIKWPS